MKVSKTFYIGSIIGGPLVGVAIFIAAFVAFMVSAGMAGGAASTPKMNDVASVVMMGGGGVLLLGVLAMFAGILYTAIVWMVLLYKAWSSIQDGQARTTPGQAVGFMFIPLFNLYWQFQAVWGFAVDYNKYLERHGVGVPRLPDGLFLAMCILPFTMIVPFVNMFVGLGLLVVQILVVAKMCDAINALPPRGVTMMRAAGA